MLEINCFWECGTVFRAHRPQNLRFSKICIFPRKYIWLNARIRYLCPNTQKPDGAAIKCGVGALIQTVTLHTITNTCHKKQSMDPLSQPDLLRFHCLHTTTNTHHKNNPQAHSHNQIFKDFDILRFLRFSDFLRFWSFVIYYLEDPINAVCSFHGKSIHQHIAKPAHSARIRC